TRALDERTELLKVWDRTKERFAEESRPQHRGWLNITRPVGLLEDTALLAAPNDIAREYIDRELRGKIAKVFSEEFGREIRVAVTVDDNADDADEDDFDAENDSEP